MEEAEVREIARDEIASLCGLVLNRVSEIAPDGEQHVKIKSLKRIFGEALSDFSGHTRGEAPGEAH